MQQQTLSVTQKEGFRLENIMYELFVVSRLHIEYFHKYSRLLFLNLQCLIKTFCQH